MDQEHHAQDANPDADGAGPPAPSGRLVVSEPREPTKARRPLPIALTAIALVVIGVLAASQIHLINTLQDTQAELDATQSQISSLDSRIAGVGLSVEELAVDIDGLTAALGAAGSSSTPAQSVPAGHLPPFVQGQADQAVGMVLGQVEGPDAYTGEALSIDPSDGTRRIWMVWAHWCPYCQQELPELTELHPTIPSEYPGVELATVTTSIDPTRGNPLDAYLTEQQFPFTVVVDDAYTLASQFGVNAFPFWVVTDGDGTVIARLTGYLDEARLDALFRNVSDYEA